MSLEIETLNLGKVENFGYNGPDVSEIILGELPPISFVDFARYSSNTLIIALEGQNDIVRDSIESFTDSHLTKVESLPIRENAPRSLQEDTIDDLEGVLQRMEPNNHNFRSMQILLEEMKSVENNDIPQDLGNPFSIMDSGIMIGEKYRLTVEEFAYFTSYALAGGHFRWGSRGVPRVALMRLREYMIH